MEHLFIHCKVANSLWTRLKNLVGPLYIKFLLQTSMSFLTIFNLLSKFEGKEEQQYFQSCGGNLLEYLVGKK